MCIIYKAQGKLTQQQCFLFLIHIIFFINKIQLFKKKYLRRRFGTVWSDILYITVFNTQIQLHKKLQRLHTAPI